MLVYRGGVSDDYAVLDMNGEEFGFEAIFEALVETIPEPVFFTDLEGSILSISQRAVDMLGYPSKEKLLGQPAGTLMAPEEQERAASIPQDASEEKLQHVEFQFKHKNGTTFPVELSVVPVRSPTGKGIGFMALGRDISERQYLRKKLENTHKELETLMNSTSAILYVASTEDNHPVIYITQNVEEITGFKPDEFLSDPDFWHEHIHSDDRHKVDKAVDDLFESGHRVYDYRFLCKDGGDKWMRDEMQLRVNEEGVDEIVGFMVDITPRKETELALRETIDKFEKLANVVSDGTSIHD